MIHTCPNCRATINTNRQICEYCKTRFSFSMEDKKRVQDEKEQLDA